MSKRLLTGGLLTASAALALLAGHAMAQDKSGDEHHRHGRMMEHLDANGDGQITRDEVKAAKAEKFKEIDANGDGQITAEEMRAHREQKMQDRFLKRYDANGDGRVTEDEFAGDDSRMFDRLDKNGDGVISQDEMKAARGMHKHRRGHRGDAPKQGD